MIFIDREKVCNRDDREGCDGCIVSQHFSGC